MRRAVNFETLRQLGAVCPGCVGDGVYALARVACRAGGDRLGPTVAGFVGPVCVWVCVTARPCCGGCSAAGCAPGVMSMVLSSEVFPVWMGSPGAAMAFELTRLVGKLCEVGV